MAQLFYSQKDMDTIRTQIRDYLLRNKITPTSLALLMKLHPATLIGFLKGTKIPQNIKLSAMEQWLEEYDHVDFRVRGKK